jgi:DNA polymerase III delta prime subunit
MPQADSSATQTISPKARESRSDEFTLPAVSPNLVEVLYRAAIIGGRFENEVNVSFTSILLGFLASKTPLSLWFQRYTSDANIAIEKMVSYQKTSLKNLKELQETEMLLSVPGLELTQSAKKIFRAAEELARLTGASGPFALDEHHVMAAYIYRCPPEHEGQLKDWRFSRINWSNAFLSFLSLVRPELREDELKQWKEIHHETFKQEPQILPPAQATPLAPMDVTQMHLDSPSEVDYLGRKGFADALAERLNRVWRESNRTDEKGNASQSRSSFILHMHGPWGSGKTSLLKFLQRELQPPRAADADDRLRWVVVEFNAWQHQRINPPWWPLLDTVYARAFKQLASENVFGEKLHAWRVRFSEHWWRFWTGRKVYLLTTIVAFALAALLFWLTQTQAGDANNVAALVKSVVTYGSVVVGVWSSVLLVSRSLLSGSSRSAQAFMENAGDPMERICAHFGKLIRWVGKPVVIFIDDLDRCQPKYVVDLLEGIQTLFSDPRVVYVIAADRRWLNTCFETSYKEFADAVKEPGRRLGSLFLEKAFELSVSVPRMSREMREVYWEYLVHGGRADIEKIIEEESSRVEEEFIDAETEEQVFSRLTAAKTGNPLRDQVRTGAAVRRLASRKVVASTEYFLKPFAPLLEPNPRAMKRLVNAYAVLRDMALLAGVNVLGDINERRQLALWAIVSLRWPLLEEYLEEHPDVIDFIPAGKMKGGESLVVADPNLQKLIESEEVKNVFSGEEIGTSLESKIVRKIIGISDAHATAASVA